MSAMRRAVGVVLALALSACTTTHLSRSGATTSDFERDDAECKAQSRVLLISIESRYRDCMLARGYKMH